MQEGGDIAHGRGRRSETHAGDAESVGARTTPASGGCRVHQRRSQTTPAGVVRSRQRRETPAAAASPAAATGPPAAAEPGP